MKKIISVAATIILGMILSAVASADFQYDPEMKMITGSYNADFCEIWVDGALAGADHISIEVPTGEHLIEVYDDGVLVYSEVISTGTQAEAVDDEEADHTAEDTEDDGERWANPVTTSEDENGNVIMMFGDTVVYNEEDAVLPAESGTGDENGQEEAEADAVRIDGAATSAAETGQEAESSSGAAPRGGMLLPISIAIAIIIVVVAVDLAVSARKRSRGA